MTVGIHINLALLLLAFHKMFLFSMYNKSGTVLSTHTSRVA